MLPNVTLSHPTFIKSSKKTIHFFKFGILTTTFFFTENENNNNCYDFMRKHTYASNYFSIISQSTSIN